MHIKSLSVGPFSGILFHHLGVSFQNPPFLSSSTHFWCTFLGIISTVDIKSLLARDIKHTFHEGIGPTPARNSFGLQVAYFWCANMRGHQNFGKWGQKEGRNAGKHSTQWKSALFRTLNIFNVSRRYFSMQLTTRQQEHQKEHHWLKQMGPLEPTWHSPTRNASHAALLPPGMPTPSGETGSKRKTADNIQTGCELFWQFKGSWTNH